MFLHSGLRAHLIRSFAAGVVSVAAAAPALAQQAPAQRPDERDRPEDQEPIIVEGERYEQRLDRPQTPLPILDTPQTVTVLPEKLIEEQGQTTLRDALRNITGISIQAGEGSIPGGGDAFSVRGFSAREDILVDGMRDVGMYFRDPFNVYNIEVTKGPASAFAGRGNVGGTVNLLSRRPLVGNWGSVELTAGTADLLRATSDVNFTISEDLGAAMRINTVAHSSDVAGRDVTFNRRWAIAPSLAVGIDRDTTFTVNYLHIEQDSLPDYGVPNARNLSLAGTPFSGRPVPVRRSNFYGYSTDYFDIRADVVTARLEHEFTPDLLLRSQARYGRAHNDSQVSAPLLPNPAKIDDTTQVFGRAKLRDQVDTILINQTSLSARFGSPAFRHTVVGGVELSRETSENRRRLDFDGPLTNLFNPLLQPIPTVPYNGTRARMDVDQTALYLFDTVEIGQSLRLLAGLRFDSINTRVRSFDDAGLNPGYIVDLTSRDREWSYNGAFIWKPSQSSSVYLAYGTSFEPAGRVEVVLLAGRDNRPPVRPEALNAEPERSAAWELGGRLELSGGRATVSAALFQISRRNARTPGANPTDPAVILNGAQRVRGFELQLVGELGEGWNLITGYAYMHGEISRSPTPGEVGQRLDNLPRHSFNIWTSYQLTPHLLVGGGIQHVGSRISGRPVGFVPVTVPAYTVGDLFAEYRFGEDASIRLNLNNVTDERYFYSFMSNHSIPAPARSASVALTLGF